MKTLKFYKYFAIIMLLLNISMVTFFVISKPKHPNKMGQKMPPPPVLNLSEVQSEQFYVLVNEHKIEMQSISDSQAEILTQYFKTLYEPNELSKEAALSNFCALENQKIQSTYNRLRGWHCSDFLFDWIDAGSGNRRHREFFPFPL